jgi:HEAT repeat protein
MSVSVALDNESQPDVVRELLLALGRMRSNEAVKVLARTAEPGGKVFKRKPLSTRLAAIEALGLAGGPATAAALKGLAEDPDASIRDAVAAALGAEGPRP